MNRPTCRLLKIVPRGRHGATTAEQVFVVVLIAIVCIANIGSLGNHAGEMFGLARDAMPVSKDSKSGGTRHTASTYRFQSQREFERGLNAVERHKLYKARRSFEQDDRVARLRDSDLEVTK